jgi:hypothetical protein
LTLAKPFNRVVAHKSRTVRSREVKLTSRLMKSESSMELSPLSGMWVERKVETLWSGTVLPHLLAPDLTTLSLCSCAPWSCWMMAWTMISSQHHVLELINYNIYGFICNINIHYIMDYLIVSGMKWSNFILLIGSNICYEKWAL